MAALGRVLAEPIVSRATIPPRGRISSMDGYAVRSHGHERNRRARRRRPDHRRRHAVPRPRGGRVDADLHRRAASRGRRRAVVPQEDVAADGDRVTVRGRIAPGALRDAPAGKTFGPVTWWSSPAASSARRKSAFSRRSGYSQVRVYRRPRVAILSTGNEPADLTTQPGPAQIPNTNTYSLDGAGDRKREPSPSTWASRLDQLEAIIERGAVGTTVRRRARDVRGRVGRRARSGPRGARAERR